MSSHGMRLPSTGSARRLGLLLVVPLACVSCAKPEAADPRVQAPLVRVAVVEAASAGTRSFTGTVAARVQSDLGFRVAGKVVARLVDAGQTVKRGTPLMRIDPIDLKLATAAQEQAVAAARAVAEQTAKDERRYRDLRGTGAVSESAYEEIKAAADAAQARLSAAESQADVARNASVYAELTAADDGVVIETLAEPGQVVSIGQPVVRLAHAGRREAVIQLPETVRPALGSAGTATVFGADQRSVPVRLRQLSHAADRVTRTFEARYVLDGELANAPLGATVTVQLPDGAAPAKDSLQVPLGALIDVGHGPGIWLISGSPAHVSWKPITVQRVDGERAQVAGELHKGDRIVALGAHLLREGDAVRVADAAAAATATGTTASSAEDARP